MTAASLVVGAAFSILLASAFGIAIAAVVTAFTTLVAASASLLGKILSVKSFGKFLSGGLAYRFHLSCEMEGLACHGMVEIHLDAVFSYAVNLSLDDLSLGVEHGDDIAYDEKVFAYLSLDFKCSLGKVEFVIGVVFAVSVGGGEYEIKAFAGLFSFHCRFKERQEHTGALDVFQRTV